MGDRGKISIGLAIFVILVTFPFWGRMFASGEAQVEVEHVVVLDAVLIGVERRGPSGEGSPPADIGGITDEPSRLSGVDVGVTGAMGGEPRAARRCASRDDRPSPRRPER